MFTTKEKTIAPNNSLISNLKQPEASIIFTGDIMLSRGVAHQIYKNNDLYFPFKNVNEFLHSANTVFANLESPIINGRKINAGETTFRIDENLAPILKEMNISIINLANNHMMDFGRKGLLNTLKILNDQDLNHIGAGINYEEAHRPIIIEINGIKIAFLGYNDSDVAPQLSNATEKKPGTAFMNVNDLKSDLAQTKLLNPNFIIVSMHGGTEYSPTPNNRQIDFAHAAIDNGANLIIGHHPHVIQPIEKYKNGYIFYSLGNFIFDQMWSMDTREGIAIQINFLKDGIKNIKILPYLIESYSQPTMITAQNNPEIFRKIINRLNLPADDNIFNIENQLAQ